MATRHVIWGGLVNHGPSANQLGIATTVRLPFGAQDKDLKPIPVIFRLAEPIYWGARNPLTAMEFTLLGISHYGDYETWSIVGIPSEHICEVLIRVDPKNLVIMMYATSTPPKWIVQAEIHYNSRTRVGNITLFAEKEE